MKEETPVWAFIRGKLYRKKTWLFSKLWLSIEVPFFLQKLGCVVFAHWYYGKGTWVWYTYIVVLDGLRKCWVIEWCVRGLGLSGDLKHKKKDGIYQSRNQYLYLFYNFTYFQKSWQDWLFWSMSHRLSVTSSRLLRSSSGHMTKVKWLLQMWQAYSSTSWPKNRTLRWSSWAATLPRWKVWIYLKLSVFLSKSSMSFAAVRAILPAVKWARFTLSKKFSATCDSDRRFILCYHACHESSGAAMVGRNLTWYLGNEEEREILRCFRLIETRVNHQPCSTNAR